MKIWKPILLITTVILVIAGVSVAFGGEQDVPPQVIAVQPYPGEEMRVDQPLTIFFNQAMDQAATEAAISFEPTITGSFQWTDDKTLVFMPDVNWERAASYEVTIGQGATASNGLTLEEDYRFTVRIVGRLEISSTIPENGVVGVESNATITIAFNRPVVPLGSTEDLANLPTPLTIEPAIEGKGEWLNTSIFTFTPDKPLLGGSTYTVTVNAGLTDFTGATLEEDFVFSFQTLAPEILSTNPYEGGYNVRLEDPISIYFSQPMNQAATQEAFAIFSQRDGSQVAGQFSWSEDGLTMTFQPDQNLTIDTGYRLLINPNLAKGLGGAPLRQGRDFVFYTLPLPAISSTYPSDGEINVYPGYQSVNIYFNTEMNTQSFEGKLIINPEPPDITYYADVYNLSAQFEFLPETTYTVTVLAGIEDRYGNKINSDYTFSFKTGTVEDSIYLADSGSFVVTGGYRENTSLTAQVSGSPEVAFELYELPLSELDNTVWYLYDEALQNRLADRSRLVRAWTQELGTGGAYATVSFNLASEQGGSLAMGTYFLMATHRQRDWVNRMPVALAVVNSTVTYKRMGESILVWVTDMQTGNPLPDQDVKIYLDGREIAHGKTNSEGVLTMALGDEHDNQFLVITATDADHYGVWYNSSTPSTSSEDVYIYTDRPIYRPGETLYFRGVYRQRDDVTFTAGGVEQLYLRASINYDQSILLDETVTLNEFGSFSGEIQLPEDAPIGYLEITVYDKDQVYWLGSISASVAEFRVPEFSVTVTPSQDEIIAGDPLNVLVNGSFFSGGSVSNANVSWYANAIKTYFNYTGAGNYSFSDVSDPYFYYYDCFDCGYYGGYQQRYLGDGTGTTDGNGNFLIELTQTTPQGPYPELVTIEATINDESGQYISGRSTAIIHPGEVYVGIRTDRYFGEEGKPFNAELITVTPQSDIVPDQAVKVTLYERRWERTPVEGQFGRYTWEVKEIEVESQDITTDANGMASVSFTPPNAGIFLVRAETRDNRERLHRSGTTLWVTGSTYVWWGEPSNTIDMIADKDGYAPGDTAQILVPVSLQGRSWLLITVERDGVMEHKVVPVDGSTYVYELPITDAHAPTVYVSAVLMHGIDEDNLAPVYRIGTLGLQVEPTAKLLDLTVTPSNLTAQPGETVTLDVEAHHPDGSPAQAEVGLALVDSAILTLASPNSQEPEDHYYGYASNYTYTDTMLTALIDGRLEDLEKDQEEANRDALALTDGAGAVAQEGQLAAAPAGATAMPTATAELPQTGGGGGFEAVTVREDFQQTPLWEPSLRTDNDGRAQISVTMPDNLTIWNLSARALTTDTLVGSVKLDISSTLPLLVRPATPRFFVVGDEVTLAMVVNNNTAAAQTVNTTMQGTGFELLDGESLEQAVEIPANSRERIEWNVKILDVEYVDLTFIALGADGYQDAAKPALATGPDGTIPVYRYTAPDTTGTGGVLREAGSRTEGISIPPIADTDQGTLTIQLDPSLAVTTIDALDYLKNYPHQCIEQTVSRFLPNVMTFRALKALGVDDPELEASLRVVLDEAIDKLKKDQKPDGGWGWFATMESNPLVTAYALLGLDAANETGNDIPPDMMNGAAGFVRTNLIRPDEDTDPWLLNRQAFFFYVLAQYGHPGYAPSLGELDALYNVRLEMSHYSKAYLLQAYAALHPNATDQIDSLTSDLISAAKLSATGAHWEEDYFDWWNWNTDVRSTAIILSALIKVAPDNELLPNAVRWLMVARQGDHWETTQETAWAVMGLTDWMLNTNELQGDYDYALALNGSEQTTGQVTPETVREGQKLVIEVGDLLLDEINRVTVIRGEGEGALYYTAHLRLRLDANEVDAINRGVGITREYFIGDSDTPVTEAMMGDIITVRLTVTIPETIYYFVLEDPLPAGTEALDTSLLTTTRAVEGPQLRPQYDPYYWWYWWIWDHTEIRDEQVNLYADYIPPGTYVYSYQVQATVPGKFQTMPSHGYAFYFPEVFGRSDGELFTVKDVAEE